MLFLISTAVISFCVGTVIEYIVGPFQYLVELFSKQGSKVIDLGDKLDKAGDDLAEKVRDIGEDISNIDGKKK